MRTRLISALVFLTSLGVLTVIAGDPGVSEKGAEAGLAGFEGSGLCQTCHLVQYGTWESSLHARTVHSPGDREVEILSQSLLCGDYDARYVLGLKHARRFMVESGQENGMHVLLPCRYDVGSAEWTHLHENDWESLTWERGCGACHTTGFSSDNFTYKEMKVACESCHGPGSMHGDYKSTGGMLSFGEISSYTEVQVCGSCHLQGGVSRKTGLNYAYNFRAGDILFADYEFDWTSLEGDQSNVENPIDIHQKLLIKQHASKDKGNEKLRCTSCHTIHPSDHARHEKLEREEFCYLCHARGDFEVKEYNQSCNVCEF